jgi:hypothetical protein
MRKLMLVAGLALALGAPGVATVASAHPHDYYRTDYRHGDYRHTDDRRNYDRHCRYERHRNTAFGAIAGTVGGGILGSVLSHGNAGGTLLGAGGGALTGSALARNSTRC